MKVLGSSPMRRKANQWRCRSCIQIILQYIILILCIYALYMHQIPLLVHFNKGAGSELFGHALWIQAGDWTAEDLTWQLQRFCMVGLVWSRSRGWKLLVRVRCIHDSFDYWTALWGFVSLTWPMCLVCFLSTVSLSLVAVQNGLRGLFGPDWSCVAAYRLSGWGEAALATICANPWHVWRTGKNRCCSEVESCPDISINSIGIGPNLLIL